MKMEASAFLNEIRTLNASIRTCLMELEELQALATKITASLGDERVQSSGSQDRMADCVVRILEKEDELEEKTMKLIQRRDHALELISKYCEDDCIELLYKRYHQSKSWELIAIEMNFTYKYVSGKLHRKAKAQLQKGLDNEISE